MKCPARAVKCARIFQINGGFPRVSRARELKRGNHRVMRRKLRARFSSDDDRDVKKKCATSIREAIAHCAVDRGASSSHAFVDDTDGPKPDSRIQSPH
jgi:hypothetical protein